MKTQKVIEKLIELNKWRRGDESIPQPNPTEVGEVIDRAIELLQGMLNRSKISKPSNFESTITEHSGEFYANMTKK